MRKQIQRPSHEQYVQFVEAEFGFLETEYGFNKKWDAEDQFRVVYSNGPMSVRVWGWGWGASGHMSLNLGDEELPYSQYVTSFDRKLTATTGKKQLDDLQERAFRLRNECQEILRGDLSSLVPFRPFPNAEELWSRRDFATLIERLRHTDQPLSPMWQNRYEYALKNVQGRASEPSSR
ncbi:MAG: hypothetical protein JW940_20420 [Polyangiaceae bacterium]|nr:hypothetical protein [Polyangiaceae bacterium]